MEFPSVKAVMVTENTKELNSISLNSHLSSLNFYRMFSGLMSAWKRPSVCNDSNTELSCLTRSQAVFMSNFNCFLKLFKLPSISSYTMMSQLLPRKKFLNSTMLLFLVICFAIFTSLTNWEGSSIPTHILNAVAVSRPFAIYLPA